MYFFDIEDFYNMGVCGTNKFKTSPQQWDDVFTSINLVKNSNRNKFITLYNDLISDVNDPNCVDTITALYDEWLAIIGTPSSDGELNIKIQNLKTALLNNTLDSCNPTEWIEYLATYNTYKNLMDDIVFNLKHGCDNIGYKLTASVEKTPINVFNDPNFKTKTEKTNGVYMKRTDAGSEFTGSINQMIYTRS